MTTSVRLPHRVEQALATYCVETQRTKSEVIVELLEQRFLQADAATNQSPLELARAAGFIGCIEADCGLAAQAKQNVKERIRAKHSR